MSGSIQLHPEKGVNCRLTFCPRCGGDGRDLMLIGVRDYKTRCPSCSTMNYGSRPSEKCGSCGETMRGATREDLTEHERLPSTALCDACETEVAEQRAVVASGGAYFECADCRASGVIKPSPFVARLREQENIPTPNPIGVEFDKSNCPQCGEAK